MRTHTWGFWMVQSYLVCTSQCANRLQTCRYIRVSYIYIYMYNWLRNRMKLALLAARETNCDPSIELRLVAELPHDVSTLEHLFTGQNHEGFRLSQAKLWTLVHTTWNSSPPSSSYIPSYSPCSGHTTTRTRLACGLPTAWGDMPGSLHCLVHEDRWRRKMPVMGSSRFLGNAS